MCFWPVNEMVELILYTFLYFLNTTVLNKSLYNEKEFGLSLTDVCLTSWNECLPVFVYVWCILPEEETSYFRNVVLVYV